MEEAVKRILLLCAMTVLLSGCYTLREQYMATGAVIGGAAGAIIGGAASGGSGALVGGAVGAGAGALIGAIVAPPNECWIRTRRGPRRVACY
jgi:uncharacterized protein YcfJ